MCLSFPFHRNRPKSISGFFGFFAGRDNPVSSARTREQLGWNPTGPSLLTDLGNMRYSPGLNDFLVRTMSSHTSKRLNQLRRKDPQTESGPRKPDKLLVQANPTLPITEGIDMKKTWFITGASRGFGRIWAEAALKRGDRVTATARKLAGRCRSRGALRRHGAAPRPRRHRLRAGAPDGSAGIRALR